MEKQLSSLECQIQFIFNEMIVMKSRQYQLEKEIEILKQKNLEDCPPSSKKKSKCSVKSKSESKFESKSDSKSESKSDSKSESKSEFKSISKPNSAPSSLNGLKYKTKNKTNLPPIPSRKDSLSTFNNKPPTNILAPIPLKAFLPIKNIFFNDSPSSYDSDSEKV